MRDRSKAKKPRLLVILGAGSALPCRMPSVRALDKQMKAWSRGYTNLPTYPKGATGEGIFNQLRKLQKQYHAKNSRPQLVPSVNFEQVLGEMTALASWVSPSPLGNPLSEAVKDHTVNIAWPPHLTSPFDRRLMVIKQQTYLLGKLARYMRARSRKLDVRSEPFQAYKRIFTRLREHFEVGIYTLNYDTVAIRAWPDAYTGFKGEEFDPRGIASRDDWSFIYHLHGSVHYTLVADPKGDPRVTWKSDLATGGFVDTFHPKPSMNSEFIPIIPSTIIAGGYKLDQILANPAQSFYASFVRHAQQADAILTIGYGFGDVHVNRAIQNRMQLPSRIPRSAVITCTPPSGTRIVDRQFGEFFAWQLTQTLNTDFSGAGMQPAPPSLQQLKDGNLLERDKTDRAAVWHNGFLEIEPHLEQLIGWLEDR